MSEPETRQPHVASPDEQPPSVPNESPVSERNMTFPACPVCGGALAEIRHKLICTRCHTICETCCEGGRG